MQLHLTYADEAHKALLAEVLLDIASYCTYTHWQCQHVCCKPVYGVMVIYGIMVIHGDSYPTLCGMMRLGAHVNMRRFGSAVGLARRVCSAASRSGCISCIPGPHMSCSILP